MIKTQHLRAIDYPRMPWKNGAGSTEEITRDAGTGLDGFGWRLSIADVGESGPFSMFDGYQRIISVIEGAGMQLDVDGHQSPELTLFDALAFSGNSEVVCTLLEGPIRDFNLIYSPQRYRARLQWLKAGQTGQLFSSADTLVVFSAEAGLRVAVDDREAIELARHDCLKLDSPARLLSLHCSAPEGLDYCLIEFINV